MKYFLFILKTVFITTKSLYPMSAQSVKKRNGCTLATSHEKFQHTLAGPEKSVKYRVWPGRNKTCFYHTIGRQTQNASAKVFTKSAGLPAKRRPLRFFTPRPNTARKLLSCRSEKGYKMSISLLFSQFIKTEHLHRECNRRVRSPRQARVEEAWYGSQQVSEA